MQTLTQTQHTEKCNVTGRAEKPPGSSFVSMCLISTTGSPLTGQISCPSQILVTQRLRNYLILRRSLEKMCCKGGSSKHSILYLHYCTTHGASLHEGLQLAAALNLSWSRILQPTPSCLLNSKDAGIPRSLVSLKHPYKIICYTTKQK